MRFGYQEAAAYLGLKVSTLRSLVCRKQVPHIRLTPKLVVFDRDALDAFMREKTVGSAVRP